MSDQEGLRREMRNALRLRDTEDLAAIWTANERYLWTDTAFEVMEDILRERLGELPEQNAPVYETPKKEKQAKEQEEEEEFPDFYEPKEVLWLDKWIQRVAVAVVVVAVINFLIYMPTEFQSFIHGPGFGQTGLQFLGSIALTIFVELAAIVSPLVTYFVLKAVGAGLRILMEMEFSSREEGAERP